MSIETPYLFTLAELSNIGNTRFVWPFHDLNVILFLFPCTKEKLTVCFKNGAVCPPSSCYYEVEIEAINCGSYYVYDLPNIDNCAFAYCTE